MGKISSLLGFLIFRFLYQIPGGAEGAGATVGVASPWPQEGNLGLGRLGG